MTENKDEYNGWSNRETWALALHIDNDQGLQAQFAEFSKDILISEAESPENDVHNPTYEIAKRVESEIDELKEMLNDSPSEGLKSMFDDIGSLWRVNFDEVANSLADNQIENSWYEVKGGIPAILAEAKQANPDLKVSDKAVTDKVLEFAQTDKKLVTPDYVKETLSSPDKLKGYAERDKQIQAQQKPSRLQAMSKERTKENER